jgi:hypothetical protein
MNKNDYVIVDGDYNAKVGKIPIDGILGRNGEIIYLLTPWSRVLLEKLTIKLYR